MGQGSNAAMTRAEDAGHLPREPVALYCTRKEIAEVGVPALAGNPPINSA